MASSFDDLLNQANAAYGQARAANENRYSAILHGYEDRRGRALGFLQGFGEHEAEDISRRYQQAGAKADQNLISRGLNNTTVGASIQRGLAQDQTREQGALQERLRGQYAQADSSLYGDQLGFMERRTDTAGIDAGLLAQLGMAAAGRDAAMQGGMGGGYIGPGGLGRGGAGSSMGQGPQGMVPGPGMQMPQFGFGSPFGQGVFGRGGTSDSQTLQPELSGSAFGNYGVGSGYGNQSAGAASLVGQLAGGPWAALGALGAYGAGAGATGSGFGGQAYMGYLNGGEQWAGTPDNTGPASRFNLNQRPGIAPVYDGQNYWSNDGGLTWGYEPVT